MLTTSTAAEITEQSFGSMEIRDPSEELSGFSTTIPLVAWIP
jgi:hypothetical protein